MPIGTPLTYDYRYDGSWGGLLCCLFEAYECRELSRVVCSHEDIQQTPYPVLEAVIDSNRASRVKYAMLSKIDSSVKELVEHVFLTCLPQEELWILRFLRPVFRHGPTMINKMTQPAMHTLNKAVFYSQHESHQYQGFVCFSVSQGVLWSVIEPKDQVLLLLAPHFCQCLCNEAFLIYGKIHDQALVYQNGRHEIFPLLVFEPPEPDETELRYHKLWHTFYDSISTRDCEDLRLRMTHMQKCYWKYLTEMQYNPSQAGQAKPEQSTETQSGARRPDVLPSGSNSILP